MLLCRLPVQQRGSAAALRGQRRTFLHYLVFKKRLLSPAMSNPYLELPSWQKYLREKTAEDPRYHQAFFDEIDTEKNRQGRRAEFFMALSFAVFLALYKKVTDLRTGSLQREAAECLEAYTVQHKALLLADEKLLEIINTEIDGLLKEDKRKRIASFSDRFAGLLLQ